MKNKTLIIAFQIASMLEEFSEEEII